MSELTERVRSYFKMYLTRDRVGLEASFDDGFRFSSPQDDHIDKAAYFSKCWPPGDKLADLAVEDVVKVDDSTVFALYTGTWKTGDRFRNMERIVLAEGKVIEVEVFFGLPPR
jgi:hypothetical protein